MYVYIFLIVVIVFAVLVARIHVKEHFRDREMLPSSFSRRPATETCWAHIKTNMKWNPDVYTDNEKKVLMTMRSVNRKGYEDDTRYFPGTKKYCVIPKEHLPIYNKAANEWQQPWDLYNAIPNPDSKGFFRPTQDNEAPEGLVVDLAKHTESSFRKLLRLSLIHI